MVSVSVAAGIGTLAAVAHGETLTEALVSTYNTNPQLLAERANLRATDEGVPQALAGWRPTVTFNGSAGMERQENTPFAPPTGTGPSSAPAHQSMQPKTYSLTMTQQLYNGGNTVAKTAQAEDLVQAERARLIATESAALFTAASAYLDVLRDQAVVQLDRNNEQVLARQLDITNDQFRVGQVTRTDVAQAQSALAAAQATRLTDQGTLENDMANYTHAVGHPPVDLVQPVIKLALPTTREQALTLASTENPNVIAAEYSEDAARDLVAATKAQLLPSLALVGNVQRLQESQLNGREQTNLSGIAQLTVPLYEAGNIWSQSRQAIENVGKAQSTTDDTRRQAVQTATGAWETIASAGASIASLQTTIQAAQIALEGITQQQQVGQRTVQDVLIQQQTLFTDQVNLAKAQHDQAVAKFNLSEQIGRLNAVDLKLPVKIYDVNVHYKSVRDKAIGFDVDDGQ
ncbi:MAG TPA: TolC family outer membrane protein [Stellaceae bacterium]|nr:TolC family outer membrane protein [Stellaceae bacterium]